MKNNKSIQELVKIFKTADRYQAHKEAGPLLQQISRDSNFLFEMIKYNLSRPNYLNRVRHYPTLSMEIFENEDFSFVANLWLPLPDKRTDLSFQSIHHHGNLILTTISAFGPGYNSILFKKGFQIDKPTGETLMEVDKIYHNPLYNLEFIDAYTPHVVFFPVDCSITYALWSTQKPKSSSSFKKVGIIKKYKKSITNFLVNIGFDKILGMNTANYFDFCPQGDKLIALEERLGYKEGSNENFIQNVFHLIQKTGFNDYEFLKRIIGEKYLPETAIQWIKKYINGEEILSKFEECHLNIKNVQLTKEDILMVVK